MDRCLDTTLECVIYTKLKAQTRVRVRVACRVASRVRVACRFLDITLECVIP